MNRSRVAALFRALANEFDEEPRAMPANDVQKRKRPRPLPIAPARLPTDLERHQARQELRRVGYRAGAKR